MFNEINLAKAFITANPDATTKQVAQFCKDNTVDKAEYRKLFLAICEVNY